MFQDFWFCRTKSTKSEHIKWRWFILYYLAEIMEHSQDHITEKILKGIQRNYESLSNFGLIFLFKTTHQIEFWKKILK